MIISFSVSNWRLFRDEIHFSMLATSEKQHKEHLAEIKSLGIKVLPTAAVYGGNASGKSSLIKALEFTKDFVAFGPGPNPDAPIPRDPFKLDPEYLRLPSSFKTEFVIHDKCYEYHFSITDTEVIEETLTQILKTSEKILFQRKKGKLEILHLSPDAPEGEESRLKFVFEGTRDNQLFLTNAYSQKIEAFKPVYIWFRDCLQIIGGNNSLYSNIPLNLNIFSEEFTEHFSRLDTGISKLIGKDVLIEELPLPRADYWKRRIPPGSTVIIRDNLQGNRYVLTNQHGEIIAKQLKAMHNTHDNHEIEFDLYQESDGTCRYIDLSPFLMDLESPSTAYPRVYVIDELDRSLHHELLRGILERFLESRTLEQRSQLIFSTHNLLTMDQKLLRRDEMWLLERTSNGSAQLIPISDYKDVRSDKDIRKSYLQGRLGGLPDIQIQGSY